MTMRSHRWWGRPRLYVVGRDARLDLMVRTTLALGSASVAGCAAGAAASGLGENLAAEVLLWAVCAGAIISMGVWFLTPKLLSGWQATAFTLIADLGVAAGLNVLTDRRLTFAGSILFVLIGGYVTIHVPQGGLVLHVVFVGVFTINAAFVMAVQGDVSPVVAVIGAGVWLWVGVAVPLTVRWVWVDTATHAELASYDPLTGVLNRAGLEQAYRDLALLARAEHLTMVVIAVDLDAFKAVNDLYGHPVGDAVLIETTHLLTHHYGRGSAVARCGGEEFTVIAVGTPTHLRQLLHTAPTATPGIHGPAVTMSVGVVVCDHRAGPDALRRAMASSDQAMYVSKRSGGNTITMHGPPP